MPTSNPIPSSDPSDLLFNAQKLDETVNSASLTFTDRLGAPRKTMAGIQAAFDAQLSDAESDLNVYRADAAASAAEALGYLQTYRATSYGALASDPATDPLGNPPTVGDEYFNTTSNLLKRFNGATWQASDINTANLAATSGSSLVGFDGGTAQDVLDNAKPMQGYTALRAYSGRATGVRITTPGITGFFQRLGTVGLTDNGVTVIVDAAGRAWERLITNNTVSLKWAEVKGDGVTENLAAIQRTISATPSGGTLLMDVSGTVLFDLPTSNWVLSDLGSNKLYYGFKFDKPIRVIGSPDCVLKIKNFSTAWQDQGATNTVTGILINSSFVHVDGVVLDANGDNHYEVFGGFKWWEGYAASLKRPPSGITIHCAPGQANTEDVLVEKCKIYSPLAGIQFYGNALDSLRSSFMSGDLKTGVVKNCTARGNHIYRHRGNAVIFNMGADGCLSTENVSTDGMYYAGRVYSRARNCRFVGDRSYVSVANVIARYNATDNGYWRTDDPSATGGIVGTENYKIQTSGIRIGGHDSYTGGTYSVDNCEIINCVSEFVPIADDATMGNYYMLTYPRLAGFSCAGLPRTKIHGNTSIGSIFGVAVDLDYSIPVDTIGVSVCNNVVHASYTHDLYLKNQNNVVMSDNTVFVKGDKVYKSAYIYGAKNTTFENDFGGNIAVGCYAVNVAGDCTGSRLGVNKFSSGIPKAQKYVLEAGSAQVVLFQNTATPLLSGAVISGGVYTAGWVEAYPTPGPGQRSTMRVENDCSVTLCIRLSGASATGGSVATLTPHFRPVEDISFTAINVSTNTTLVGIISATTGVITITLPAYPSPTLNEIRANISYSVNL